MHYTAILGEHIDDAQKYGWNVDESNKKHNWYLRHVPAANVPMHPIWRRLRTGRR